MTVFYKFLVLFLAISFNACKKNVQHEIESIPSEFHGRWIWINESGDWFIIINENSIINIHETGGESDTIRDVISKIYQVNRRNCNDCLNYGILIHDESYDKYGTKFYYYLNNYQPRLMKYLEMVEIIKDENELTGQKYTTENVWKRDDIINHYD